MIYESGYWKRDLLRIANRLAKRTKQPSSSDRIILATEKDIFIGCYIVRKLIESNKITSINSDTDVPVTYYPCIKKVDVINRFNWPNLYNLKKESKSKIKLSEFYNRIIHSYILEQSFDESSKVLSGFFFNSDRNRNSNLYFIEALDVIKTFRLIGKDNVNKISIKRNANSGEMLIEDLS